MKALFFAIALSAITLACNDNDDASAVASNRDSADHAAHQQAESDSANWTSIQWLDSISQDKGSIKEGAVLDIGWRFKNVGDKPLVIIKAEAGCGCTVAEKPEQPIPPGGEGVIKAKFESKGRPGQQNKNVIVRANTRENMYDLRFSVDVKNK